MEFTGGNWNQDNELGSASARFHVNQKDWESVPSYGSQVFFQDDTTAKVKLSSLKFFLYFPISGLSVTSSSSATKASGSPENWSRTLITTYTCSGTVLQGVPKTLYKKETQTCNKRGTNECNGDPYLSSSWSSTTTKWCTKSNDDSACYSAQGSCTSFHTDLWLDTLNYPWNSTAGGVNLAQTQSIREDNLAYARSAFPYFDTYFSVTDDAAALAFTYGAYASGSGDCAFVWGSSYDASTIIDG